ncbi:MAG: phospholipase [Paludibacteraceae bacterium]|nr:phospholipase [Paludibacteraceae bacterium]
MLPLILFVLLGIVILVLFEWRARCQSPEQRASDDAEVAQRERQNIEGECCGQHLVCEREQVYKPVPDYYDDEELDAYAHIPVEQLTDIQELAIREVFRSLRETDVTGWVRSMQQRDIALPSDVREEALFIVREQRNKKSS